MWRLALLVMCGALAACFSSGTSTCGDLVCPPDRVCSPDGTVCVLPAQITACNGLAEGAPCTFGQASGACGNHVCTPAGCGNRVLEPGEACDDGNVVSGDGCSADCKSTEQCGNAYVDIHESCDCGDGSQPASALAQACGGKPNSNDPGAFCRPDCRLGGCGDGIRDPSEECEGGDLGGRTCQDLGYYSGTLTCLTGGCTFDRSACSGKCGDNILDPQEQCDGAQLNGHDCTSLGYYSAPGLSCNSACVLDPAGCTGGKCGDGIVNGPEPCDGPGPTGITCQDVGFHAGSAVTCTSLCTLDESQCSETCGDGIKNGPEDCDGTDLGGARCVDLGWYGGTLKCRSFCSYDQSGCVGKCGDGVVDGGESCDGASLGTKTCSDFGFAHSPGLACTLCSYDTTDCMGICGDGYIESPEVCDAPSFAGRTCLDSGFASGRLACGVLCGETHEDCGGFGWQQLNSASIAVGAQIGGVAFFGTSTGVLRYDGTTWTSWNIGSVSAISGTSATDVWALAAGTYVYHFNGTTWAGAGATGATNQANGLYEASPTDVFVVGFGEIEHYNGTAWTKTSLANGEFYAAWGTSGTNVYAVGDLGGIWHYDGTSWTQQTVGASSYNLFNAVWGSGPNDVNAVSDVGVIAHFDGTSWTTLQPLNLAGVNLGGVFSRGASDLYVGGTNLAHWDGSSWTSTAIASSNIHAIVPLGGSLLVGTESGVYRGTTAWQTSALVPPSRFLAVWEAPNGELHVPAEYDSELIYSGGAWTTRFVQPGNLQASMWGTGPSDIFLGMHNSIHHWDGTSWSLSMSPVSNSSEMISMTGTASNNVWAIDVGGSAYHYNGSTWAQSNAFALGTSGYGIWVFAAEEFAVGSLGHIAHQTSGGWKAMTSPTSQDLRALWGVSNTNLWAVGFAGTILHYDGMNWTTVTSPVTDDLMALWGTGASNIYAAGAAGDILHYDGTSWTRVMTVAGIRFRSVYGISASDVWAAGYDASDSGVLYHYDGTAWRRVLPYGGPINALSGTIAVGNAGTALHFDGALWMPSPTGTTRDLHGLYGPSSSDLTAVGAGGTMLHWNGTAWSSVTSGTTMDLNAIWNGTSVGAGGTIVNGGSPMSSGTTQDLLAVWGTTTSNVYAVGRAGTLLHGNGASWTAIASGTTHDLYAIAGSGPNNIWAVGDFGVVTHWDGTSWRASWSGTPEKLDAVYVGGTGDVLAGGATGQLLFYDGARWTTIQWPYPGAISAFDGTAASLQIAGTQGTIGGLVRPMSSGGGEVCGDRWDNDNNGLADTSDTACGTPPPAESCTNGLDDDRDGLTDCEDPDCTGITYCVRGGACQAVHTIKCGDTVTGTTAAAPKLDNYPCAPRGEAGGEANYKLLVPAATSVTATVSSSASLDVIATGASAGACEPWTQCYAGGMGSVTFSAPAGASYLIIDSPLAFSANFTLTVTCP